MFGVAFVTHVSSVAAKEVGIIVKVMPVERTSSDSVRKCRDCDSAINCSIEGMDEVKSVATRCSDSLGPSKESEDDSKDCGCDHIKAEKVLSRLV